MTVRKLDDGKPLSWLADIRPGGRNGPRRRKRFATKGEATAWELWQLEQSAEKPWLGEEDEQVAESPVDARRLADLVERWYGLHGQSLRDGEQRRSKLLLICESLGNPLASDFTGPPERFMYDRVRASTTRRPARRDSAISVFVRLCTEKPAGIGEVREDRGPEP